MSRRAVSTTVNYVLTLGITTLLITGLLIAGGDFLQNQREETTRTELTVVGQQLAGTLSAADGLAESSTDTGRFTISRDLPDSVGGTTYTIRIENTGTPNRYDVILEAGNDVSVTVGLTTQTEVEPVDLTGGDVAVSYDATGSDALVVDSE